MLLLLSSCGLSNVFLVFPLLPWSIFYYLHQWNIRKFKNNTSNNSHSSYIYISSIYPKIAMSLLLFLILNIEATTDGFCLKACSGLNCTTPGTISYLIENHRLMADFVHPLEINHSKVIFGFETE